ncbi:MAG: hypothetical protein AAF441_13275 [Pseudomonadota bacterium]
MTDRIDPAQQLTAPPTETCSAGTERALQLQADTETVPVAGVLNKICQKPTLVTTAKPPDHLTNAESLIFKPTVGTPNMPAILGLIVLLISVLPLHGAPASRKLEAVRLEFERIWGDQAVLDASCCRKHRAIDERHLSIGCRGARAI